VTRVACIGECMVEFRAAGEGLYRRSFAGDAYNTAVYLKRSAPGVDVGFVTATGDDPLSRDMRAAWRAEGIDASLAFTVAGARPGLYMIDLDARGERRFGYWRQASPARRWLALLEAHGGADAIAGADLVYLSGVSLAILEPPARSRALELMAALRPRVGAIAFDPNVRPVLWESPSAMRDDTARMIACASIVTPSGEDGELMWVEVDVHAQLARYRALGAAEVAMTLGAGGCLVATEATEPVALAAPAADVIDTSGGGDAFNGGYLAARLQGRAPAEAARAGLALAARVVGCAGALVPAEISHPGGHS